MTVEEVHFSSMREVIAVPDQHKAQPNTGLELRNEASPDRLSHLLRATVEVRGRGIKNEIDVGIIWLKAIAGEGGNHLTIIDTHLRLQEMSFDSDTKVECNDITDADPADHSTLQQQVPG